MSTVFLRVKIKSLAAEARIIRREETRWPHGHRELGGIWSQLNSHRRRDVRPEARSAQLAYGLLRGRRYAVMEAKVWEAPDLPRIAYLVGKYGTGRNLPTDKAQLLEWVKDWLHNGTTLPVPVRPQHVQPSMASVGGSP